MGKIISSLTTGDLGFKAWNTSIHRYSRGGFEVETTSSDSVNSESGIGMFVNAASRAKLERVKEFERRFVELSRSEHFEYGYSSSTEMFTLEFSRRNSSSLCIEALVRVFWNHTKDTGIAVAVLNALSALPYDKEFHGGQTLAVAATAIADPEVKEAAIRVFERWGNPGGVDFLSKIECPWLWLDDYRKQVIEDLKPQV